jgi:hypothetical protein
LDDDFVEARTWFEKSHAALVALEAASPARYGASLVTSLAKLGEIAQRTGDLSTARRFHEQRMKRAERVVRDDEANVTHRHALAQAYSTLAGLHALESDNAGATDLYEQAVSVLEPLNRSDPGRAQWAVYLAIQLAQLAQLTRDGAAHRTYLERAQRVLLHLIERDENQDEALMVLADVENWLGDREAAREHSQAALAVLEARSDQAGASPNLLLARANCLERLQTLSAGAGDNGDALTFAEQALELREAVSRSRALSVDEMIALADAYQCLGAYALESTPEVTVERFEQSRRLLEAHLRLHAPGPAVDRPLAAAYRALGRLAFNDDPGRARIWQDQRLVVIERRLANNNRSQEWLSEQAECFADLGEIATALEQWKNARDWFDRARLVREILVESHPEDRIARLALAQAYASYSDSLEAGGDEETAVEFADRACTLHEALVAETPNDVARLDELAAICQKLAQRATKSGEHGRVHRAYQQAVFVRERLAKLQPQGSDATVNLVKAMLEHGDYFFEQKAWADAVAAFERVASLLLRDADTAPAEARPLPEARRLTGLGNVYARIGRARYLSAGSEAARDALDKSRRAFEAAVQEEPEDADSHYRLADACYRLGYAELSGGAPSAAREPLERAREIFESLQGQVEDIEIDLANCYRDLAVLDARDSNPKAECAWLEKRHALLLDLGAANRPNWLQIALAECRERLAEIAHDANDLPRERVWLEAACIAREELIDNNPLDLGYLSTLIDAYAAFAQLLTSEPSQASTEILQKSAHRRQQLAELTDYPLL